MQLFIRQQIISPGITNIWDHMDGCGKQYRCSKALYLLSVLACTYDVIVDMWVGAPGHRKDVVERMNAQDKAFLINQIITANT